MESSSTRSSSTRRAGLPQGDPVEELPGQLPSVPAQHGQAFLAWKDSQARHGTYRGSHELPTSMQASRGSHELPTFLTSMQAALLLLSHTQHTPEPQIQGSLTLSSSQLKNKGFPLPAPRRISLAHSRQAPKCCPIPWISPAPSPADQGHLAMGSGHQHSSPSPSQLLPNQGEKQHPGLVSTNELSQQHTQHQHKPCLTARPELAWES